MTTTPAGGYQDAQGVLRYWDGAGWTQHTAPQPPAAPPAPGATIVVHERPPVPAASPLPPYANPQPSAYQVPAHWQSAPPTAPGQHAMVAINPAPTALAPNGVGTAGFVVGLVSVFLPIFLGLIGGAVGLVLSIVGVAQPQRRKGLAIAGLVLSSLAIILLI